MLKAMAISRAAPKIKKKRRSQRALRDTTVVRDGVEAAGVPSGEGLAGLGAANRSSLRKAQPQAVFSDQHHAQAFFSSHALTTWVSAT
jgi:hypothetical protein